MPEPITRITRPRAEIAELTAAGRCVCCGLPGAETHHDQWWCRVCLSRDHHRDGPFLATEDTEGDT